MDRGLSMYKFISENSVYAATEHDRLRFNNEGTELTSFYLSDQELKVLGFKELIRADQPEVKEFYHIETSYKDGSKINEVHQLVKDSEPDIEKLVHGMIRERYTDNDEWKMARVGIANPEWIKYNAYVEECKKQAYETLERWRKA